MDNDNITESFDNCDIIDADMIVAELDEGGGISKLLTNHEKRTSQLDLVRIIVKAFNEDSLAVIEAGTGVGKSFAYLISALAFAEKTGERVVISTATITLQRQLFEKDIPFISSALGISVKSVLVKGRGNYICRRRLAISNSDISDILDLGEDEALKKIIVWSETTKTGDKSDIPFVPKENLWRRVASEADTCLGSRCPEREHCFVTALRKETAAAGLIIVNHHLLFADLSARDNGAGYEGTVVLPPYQRVIIDEAHTIENSATNFFANEFNRFSINLLLGRLFRQKGAAYSGLLFKLLAYSGGCNDKTEEWSNIITEIKNTISKLDVAALELCGTDSVFRLIQARNEIIRLRLNPNFIALSMVIDKFLDNVNKIITEVEKRVNIEDVSVIELKENPASDAEITLRETNAVLLQIKDISQLCIMFTEYFKYTDDVFWLERRLTALKTSGASDYAVFTRTPVEVSKKLQNTLFEKHKTVVCLSATISVAGRFDYWISRSGIMLANNKFGEKRAVLTESFTSPFPYSEAVLLAVPEDGPVPAENSFQNFINNSILKLIETAGGSALILFTSFDSLNSAYKYSALVLAKQGFNCFRQGDDDRTRLLNAFIEDEKSVLFATDSFWEGVDAPGNTLKLVVLCRLPFKTPNDPVFEARCERVERYGKNPFMEISIPESIIKFRQGFGRLMRSSRDYGAVVVLDSRILKKRYGELFLRSLPNTQKCFGSFNEILKNIRRFV